MLMSVSDQNSVLSFGKRIPQKKEKTRKLFGLMAGEERLYLGATKDTVPSKLM